MKYDRIKLRNDILEKKLGIQKDLDMKVSEEWIAKKIGIHRITLHRAIRPGYDISGDTLIMICKWLERDVGKYLVG